MNTNNPIRYVVNFGSGKAGLSSVGFVLKDFDRTTVGVTELVPGSGIYEVTLDRVVTPSFILWDTGDDPIRYGIEDINVSLNDVIFQSVNFGKTFSGLASVGATIAGVRTVALELAPESGIYGGSFTPPRGYRGPIIWDTGQGPDTFYTIDTTNLHYELISFYQMSSSIFRKVTDTVGMIETRDAVGDIGEGGYLLLDNGEYLLLGGEGYMVLRDPSGGTGEEYLLLDDDGFLLNDTGGKMILKQS